MIIKDIILKVIAMMVDIMSDSSNSNRISNPGYSFSALDGNNICKNIDDQAQDDNDDVLTYAPDCQVRIHVVVAVKMNQVIMIIMNQDNVINHQCI